MFETKSFNAGNTDLLCKLLGIPEPAYTNYVETESGATIGMAYDNGHYLKLTKPHLGPSYCEYNGSGYLSQGRTISSAKRAEIDAATAQIAFTLAKLGFSVELSSPRTQ